MTKRIGAKSGKNTDKKPRKVNPRSLANLAPAWKPGESGNPAGRPKNSIEAQTRLRALALPDVEDFYGALRAAALGKLDTSAIRLGLQLAGAMPTPEDPKAPPSPAPNPYAERPTDALLAAATPQGLPS